MRRPIPAAHNVREPELIAHAAALRTVKSRNAAGTSCASLKDLSASTLNLQQLGVVRLGHTDTFASPSTSKFNVAAIRLLGDKRSDRTSAPSRRELIKRRQAPRNSTLGLRCR